MPMIRIEVFTEAKVLIELRLRRKMECQQLIESKSLFMNSNVTKIILSFLK